MADLQATIAKLSLEKYSGVVSVLSQGGDAAGLVTDIGSLKEVCSNSVSPTVPQHKQTVSDKTRTTFRSPN